ncbi:MAG: alpha-xylosidase [Actinobacteria bacterium]|nr:alpha-xylosidase [Actinomycetota bacterium]
MKFTDGYWQKQPGYTPLYAVEVDDIRIDAERGEMVVYSSTTHITGRGDTLNRPVLTMTYSATAPGVIGVEVVHHAGRTEPSPSFDVTRVGDAEVSLTETHGVLRSGDLEVRVPRSGSWRADFVREDRVLTSSLPRSLAAVLGNDGGEWMHEQLSIEPGEQVYGLGERFGAFTKNGQVVDIWNRDGGTSSEQAYKNIPFYMTSGGYGVFTEHPELVSYEVGSEVNTRVQFSVAGSRLRYHVIAGPTPKDVLGRYTGLTGRPPRLPAWSYGLWLSTSFTTDYDEATVTSFIEGMAERGLPLSVFHFDCFWMRQYQWCDFTWDPQTFPDPEGMLTRLKARGLRICVWINPYIAQRSPLFAEGAAEGFLLKTTSGDVWQTDQWQAGMGIVDFTNPDAVTWYQTKLKVLLDQGVDAFKTDFGERVPTEGVAWFDGSDPQGMHNYYAHLYNKAVHDLLVRDKGEGEAVLFSRSSTAGGQQFPVHWGGDCDSTYASMAETLRGGLSLAMSGFGYWSHDIGGFEGTPDAGVFKRWLPFGLLSSHSRLHGSASYRVPWAFDDEAVDVTRLFTGLKLSLMPYLARLAEEAGDEGVPLMRPMVLEFPEDRGAWHVDTQFMLGDALCVSPVFRADGVANTYLPTAGWRHLLDGHVAGPGWTSRAYGFDSLGLYVRPGTVLPVGAIDDRPEYAWADGVTLRAFDLPDGFDARVHVPGGAGPSATFTVRRDGTVITASSDDAPGTWMLDVVGGPSISAAGASTVSVVLSAD